jgi:hypothetical protein
MDLMKKILSFSFLLLSISLFAGQGIILVTEAPLLRKKSLKAQVVQAAYKGDTVYIHDKHFVGSPLSPRFGNVEDDDEFYQSVDITGRDVFIPKEYVKLVYLDGRESSQDITPFDPDFTDYRPDEPLPNGYPVLAASKYRAGFSVGGGSELKGSYLYFNEVADESYSQRSGFSAFYARKAKWDKGDRFYFGGTLQVWASAAEYSLSNGVEAEELKALFGIGPYLSYDAWRNRKYRLTLTSALTVNFNRLFVAQSSSTGLFEEREFNGPSLTPRIGSFFQWREALASLDITAGVDVQINIPYTLTSKTEPEVEQFWNDFSSENDSYYVPFSAIWTVSIGIQAHY